MKRVILSSIILIFLITGMGFAFQNEPDGFRGLTWGDAPTEDMTFLGETIYSQNVYYKKDDKLNIGSATFYNIWYSFNLYSNLFYRAQLTFRGENNYDILKIICEGRYGKPTYIRKKEDSCSLWWTGDKAKISLYYDFKEHKGWFAIISMIIHPETPEDNKQKEVEKAKDDF